MRPVFATNVYNFVRSFIVQKGYPPLRTEIAEACKLRMPEVILALDILEATGRLYGATQPRTAMRLVDDYKLQEIA